MHTRPAFFVSLGAWLTRPKASYFFVEAFMIFFPSILIKFHQNKLIKSTLRIKYSSIFT